MHLRPLVLTTVFVISGLVGCTRDEFAPWGFAEDVRLQCEGDAAPDEGRVGVAYSWTPTYVAGVQPLTYAVDVQNTPLPMGLSIDAATGTISGTPTEAGTFPLTLLVTDDRGNTYTITCADIVIAEGAAIDCSDGMGGDIPDAFVGLTYTFEVRAVGGTTPYSGWTDNGTLPPGLTLTPDANDSSRAVISGAPTTAGTYNVDLQVTDAAGQVITAMCGVLEVRNPISVDPDALLEVYPDGCIKAGITMDQLIADGVVVPIPNAPDPTCELKPGRGNGSRTFNGIADSFPPGIAVASDTCELSGTIDSKLRFGIYTWITTIKQEAPSFSIPLESEGWLPYCAPQPVQAGTAYDVLRQDAGVDRTIERPGVVKLGPGATSFSYGDDTPDPMVTVTYNEQCAGSCFFAYIFAYNALSGMATVNANPATKFPVMGFDGFTHAIRVTESDSAFLDSRSNRAFVVNISYDYCIAQNNMDCGNNLGNTPAEQDMKADLIRTNGGNSNYEFGLVVLPD